VLACARRQLGYVLFYKPRIISPSAGDLRGLAGGMSFTAVLGVLLAIGWCAKHGLRWIEVTDFFAPLPARTRCGRLGNFITASFRRVTDVPGNAVRGAGPLRATLSAYQFALEGYSSS